MLPVPPSSSEHAADGKFGFPIYHAESRPQLRAWFQHNHAIERGVWLCSWRSPTGRPRCPYPEVVEEAICFGWIDSTTAILDNDRGIQLLTPRKAKSSWTRLNRKRSADMEAQGLMTEAGRAAMRTAQRNGWWTISDSVEDLVEPADLAAALHAVPAARTAWDAFSASTKKLMLWWVVTAIKPETQAQRIAAIVADAAIGKPARPA